MSKWKPIAEQEGDKHLEDYQSHIVSCLRQLHTAVLNSERELSKATAERDRAVEALQGMCDQYLEDGTTKDGRPMYYHCFMSAGEHALDVLLELGKIDRDQSRTALGE